MRVLFIHGAGGFEDDADLAAAISGDLAAQLSYPRLPGEDMSVHAWCAPVRQDAVALTPDDLLVGHSFGATIALHLAATIRIAAPMALLAMPDWGPDGWEVPGYVPPPVLGDPMIALHHCRDDEVVPYAHLSLAARLLPRARSVTHEAGGHQFTGLRGRWRSVLRP